MPVKITVKCRECNSDRLVHNRSIKEMNSTLCRVCANKKISATRKRLYGKSNPGWRGGTIDKDGYVVLGIPPDHKFISMATKHGKIREHRLIMAEFLGRCLIPSEIVHHVDGDKKNNAMQNLELFSSQCEHLTTILGGKTNAGFSYEDEGW